MAIKLQIPLGPLTSVEGLGQYLDSVYKFALGIVGIVSVVMIMIGGIIWITSAGNASKVEKAKDYIFTAIVGMLLLLGSYLILNLINPQLTEVGIGVDTVRLRGPGSFGNLEGSTVCSVLQFPAGTTSCGQFFTGALATRCGSTTLSSGFICCCQTPQQREAADDFLREIDNRPPPPARPGCNLDTAEIDNGLRSFCMENQILSGALDCGVRPRDLPENQACCCLRPSALSQREQQNVERLLQLQDEALRTGQPISGCRIEPVATNTCAENEGSDFAPSCGRQALPEGAKCCCTFDVLLGPE